MNLTDEEVLNKLDRAILECPFIIEEAQEITQALVDKLDTLSDKTLNALWLSLARLERTAWKRVKEMGEKYEENKIREAYR